jgi:DNA processing protein
MTDLAIQRTPDELQIAYSYCLSHLAHLGERSALKFKRVFPTYESWAHVPSSERDEAAKTALGKDSSKIVTLNFDALVERALADVKSHERGGIHVVPIDSSEYPELLKQISDAPLVLFVKGSIRSVTDNSNVAVVGTRNATSTGERVASKVAKWLSEQSWCVVSGLAKGIDTAAHRGTLDVRGRTAAVMATPLNKVYPAENRELANEILDNGGCWISEVPLWGEFHRSSFVQRDRIQSGLCVAVIPVQTDVEGGTMHTVRYAEQQGRLLLCPRPIEAEQSLKQYAGVRHLIETRRAIPFSGDEYAKVLHSLLERRDALTQGSPSEQKLDKTPERIRDMSEPVLTIAAVAEEPPSGEDEPRPKGKPKRAKRSRLQIGFGFIAEEPVPDKPRKKIARKTAKLTQPQEPSPEKGLSEEKKVIMTTSIERCIERAAHYQNEILQEISKVPTADTSDRSLVATAFIKMAVGDFKAILTEISNNNPGPAFKLFRLLYEDVVNGLWAQAFAKDELIDKLLHGTDGQLPGHMADRAKELDAIFVDPSDGEPDDDGTLFVHFQTKFWKTANSYTHGGSMAINRELAGYDEKSIHESLRSSTTLFIMFIDAMYRLHYKKPNDALTTIAQTYFAENW